MIGPRAAKTEEFDGVIELINKVFRIDRGCEPTMAAEFPLLLVKSNIDNMRIMKDENRIVADVNFMIDKIDIENTPITYAAIGAVCTDGDYRGQGLSSKILDDVEKTMYEKGVAICLISGTRSLYTRRGALQLLSFNKFSIPAKNKRLSFDLIPFEHKYLSAMNDLYQKRRSKYHRSLEDFALLVDSATHPWGAFQYVRYVMIEDGIVIGYVIIRLIEEDKYRYGEVVEVEGETSSVNEAIEQLGYKYKLSHVDYHLHVKSERLSKFEMMPSTLVYQQGTLKIINPGLLVSQLKPYFDHQTDKVTILCSDESLLELFMGNEALRINDLSAMTRLLFEEGRVDQLDVSKDMKEELKRLLPLPMPYTKNLNYQ